MAESRSSGVWWLDSGSADAEPAGSVYEPARPETVSAPPGAVPEAGRGAEVSSGRTGGLEIPSGWTDVTSRFPGWNSVIFEFPTDEPAAATEPVPAQREAEETVAEAEPEAAPGVGGGAGVLAGRRPSLVLLLAALALLAGALTGQLLAMLAGWGIAYLSKRLGDLTKKFVVLGVPLITMTASGVWYWGRAHGRWGTPLDQGTGLSHATWAAAPAVLRVAAALSALLLLAITLRRKPNG